MAKELPRDDADRGALMDLLLLERVASLLEGETQGLLRTHGLTRLQQRMLATLAREGELRVGALVMALGVSKQAAHAPLVDLVERGMVRSRPSPESRRVKLLSLSPAGTRRALQLEAPVRKRLQNALRQAGPKAERGWREVMQHLVR